MLGIVSQMIFSDRRSVDLKHSKYSQSYVVGTVHSVKLLHSRHFSDCAMDKTKWFPYIFQVEADTPKLSVYLPSHFIRDSD